MKTITQCKFEKIINDGFHQILKPLKFRKKGNNFYIFLNGVGHLINIQKSQSSSKDSLKFTINTGIFLPEYWSLVYNYFNQDAPDFPKESECILRRRIGHLKNGDDLWYDVNQQTHEASLIEEMKKNLNGFILPHFNGLVSKEMLVDTLDMQAAATVEKLIVFGELGYKAKAAIQFHRLMNETRNPSFKIILKDHAKRYSLV